MASQEDPHLGRTWQHSLLNAASLDFMDMPAGESQAQSQPKAEKVLMLAWHLNSHRVWSLSQHSAPPDCFAPALSNVPAEAEAALQDMKTGWEDLLMLDQRRFTLEAAKLLWQDLDFAMAKACRLTWSLYERDNWQDPLV